MATVPILGCTFVCTRCGGGIDLPPHGQRGRLRRAAMELGDCAVLSLSGPAADLHRRPRGAPPNPPLQPGARRQGESDPSPVCVRVRCSCCDAVNEQFASHRSLDLLPALLEGRARSPVRSPCNRPSAVQVANRRRLALDLPRPRPSTAALSGCAGRILPYESVASEIPASGHGGESLVDSGSSVNP